MTRQHAAERLAAALDIVTSDIQAELDAPEMLDDLSRRLPRLRELTYQMRDRAGISHELARYWIYKALRIRRGERVPGWGGRRAGAGRPAQQHNGG